jgi:hypothetical protein
MIIYIINLLEIGVEEDILLPLFLNEDKVQVEKTNQMVK